MLEKLIFHVYTNAGVGEVGLGQEGSFSTKHESEGMVRRPEVGSYYIYHKSFRTACISYI